MVKMKKIIQLFIFTILIIPMLVVPSDISADDNKTLQDLINELNQLEREARDNKQTQKLTQDRIEEIKRNVIALDKRAREIEQNIIQLKVEIENLNNEIIDKDDEIKSLIKYLQAVGSNNAYLEYAFGAATMTDFIYRVSVVEQLTTHNDNLIADMNQSITDKNNKNRQLESEQRNLDVQKRDLGIEQNKLGDRIVELIEYQQTLEEEISDAKKTLENYRQMGCKLNQTIEDCLRTTTSGPFIKPMSYGRITQYFGGDHYGVDIGGGLPIGTNIYAASEGTVVLTGRYNCGGNFVIIQHNIDGVYYATRYLHLNRIDVKDRQTVTRNTVIGGMGGARGTDACTTGPHLHFEIAKGIYGLTKSQNPQGFISFREPNIVNPAVMINFPAGGAFFTSRY